MKITQLWLLNFRNYENTRLEFADSNLIVGPNGAGKTNILEAIDILATSRSRIVKGLNKCIRHGQPGFAIAGRFAYPPFDSAQGSTGSTQSLQNDFVHSSLSGAQTGSGFTVAFRQERGTERTIKIDDEVLTRTSELIGRVNSVIFLPGDLELVHGPPVLRRKYLDIIISQTASDYYQDLQTYTRALKQRNELLKSLRGAARSAEDGLAVWDRQLADGAARILLKRREYLEFFARETGRLYNEMGFAGVLTLRYKTNVTADAHRNLELLTAARAEDVRFGRTHCGTHADDFEFWLDDSKAAEFCSQGQQRLLAIAFKCAETKIKTDKLKDPPLVLVDDVLLELDVERLNKIITALAPQSQKIFTVTDTGRFAADALQKMRIIRVKQGRLEA
ncbi:MAG: DNA replication and repair protein RecF [Candidatus Margulisbacteria bacterium]|jgi:DNA replication and repair protein RecF|nr:DNA replication and repair protein RecF [Candidatus Margulisiibacteriota bacterium]